MGCGHFIQLLSARLDGALTEQEAHKLEAHLAQCPACRALASQLAAMRDSFETLEDVPAPEGFARGVMDRIRVEERKKKTVPLFRRAWFRGAVGLAACLVLCVGIYRAGFPGRSEDAVACVTAAGAVGSDTAETGGGVEPMGRMMEPQEETESMEDMVQSDYSAAPESAEPGSASYSVEQKAVYQMENQTVSAVLTLSRLPEGAEEVLGADAEWLTDEEDRSFCIVTGGQMEALMALAREQWPEQDLAGIATNRIGAEELCAVVLTDGF